jgi:hypothetical protein
MKLNPKADAGLQQEKSTPPKVIGKPFPPGVSGNPSGRRRGSVSLTATLKRILTKGDANAICFKLISQAKAGNHQAQRLIMELCGDEAPLKMAVDIAAPAPQVVLHLPAGRAAQFQGKMPGVQWVEDPPEPGRVMPPESANHA